MPLILGPKSENMFGGWSRKATLNGIEYTVSMRRGKMVRIPYKPRGKNKGWQWHGAVWKANGCVWSDKVTKSTGVRGMLAAAGLLGEPTDESQTAKWRDAKYPGDDVRRVDVRRGDELGMVVIQHYGVSVRVGSFLPGDVQSSPGDTPKTWPERNEWFRVDRPDFPTCANDMFVRLLTRAQEDGWVIESKQKESA